MTVFALVASLAPGVFGEDRIRPSAANPRYWESGGEPVLLLGASDDDNLFQWPAEKLDPQLDRLAAAGGNVIRNTMSDRDDDNVRAFLEVEPGKYDLSKWNPAYWERFEHMLQATRDRGIFVQIEVWDRFDHSRDQWKSDPYNPTNNVNYTYEETGFQAEYPAHPNTNQQLFFFTVPGLKDIPLVRQYQEAFVDKLLSHSLKYGHVLYCIDNETNGKPEWGRYWAEFIRARSEKAGLPVQITEMWDEWRVFHQMHQNTIAHPELYDFIDLSQNAQQVGETNWVNGQMIWQQIKEQPRPINSTKIYGSEEWDRRWAGRTKDNALNTFWRNLLGGFASSRFHRPDAGQGLSEDTERMIRVARAWQEHYDVFRAVPDSTFDLLAERETDEAYASAIPGEAWTVFFTDGGSVLLTTGVTEGPLSIRWADLATGDWSEASPATAGNGGQVTLAAPGSGRWLAVVRRGT